MWNMEHKFLKDVEDVGIEFWVPLSLEPQIRRTFLTTRSEQARFGKIPANPCPSLTSVRLDAKVMQMCRKQYLSIRFFRGNVLSRREHEIVNGIHACTRAKDCKHEAVDEKGHH